MIIPDKVIVYQDRIEFYSGDKLAVVREVHGVGTFLIQGQGWEIKIPTMQFREGEDDGDNRINSLLSN